MNRLRKEQHMPDSVESIYDAVHILFNKAYISPEPSVPEDVPVHLIDETLRLIKITIERDVIGEDEKEGFIATDGRNRLRYEQRQALTNALYRGKK